MINKELVCERMNQMSQSLSELEPLLKKETSEIVRDTVVLHAIERLFQLIVDGAVSINNHIITKSGFAPVEDYQGTFTILSQNNVLPMDFSLKIAPSVGLRNQVVHKYGDVNLTRLIEEIKTDIGDFPEYLKKIDEYLKKI
ncbi:MAG: DUF86 domain-containing protein [Candidatus Parcubacteria bacterium]|nr:DUF86 domain-containing protein [Candidatus Parcubacteria bacterium]